jgi:hypothetical protein
MEGLVHGRITARWISGKAVLLEAGCRIIGGALSTTCTPQHRSRNTGLPSRSSEDTTSPLPAELASIPSVEKRVPAILSSS